MARDKQIGQHQKQSSSSAPSATSPSTAPSTSQASTSQTTTERERDIATGREGGGTERGSSLARQHSGAIREPLTSPFGLIRRMAYDLDRLFEQFGVGRSGFGFQPALRTPFDDDFLGATLSRWAPQVEIDQRGDKLVVRADLPGMKKEDLNIEVDDGVLTISGERKQEQEENRAGFYRSERSYGQFFRSIPLPEGVNADQAEASFNDGVLEVSFPAPKQDQRRGKKIQIQ